MTPPDRRLAVVAVGFSLCLLPFLGGNLAVLRSFSGSVQATLLAAILALAVPSAALVGAGIGTYRLSLEKMASGRGPAAGSVIKVSLVLLICSGFLAAIIGFQLAYGALGDTFPVTAVGALFIYRAVLALPAVGAAAALAAGLMVVERPLALVPAGVVGLVGNLAAAAIWVQRGGGTPGYELAGAALAVPVGALLGAVAVGTTLFAAGQGRERLQIHLARPFDVSDVASLLVRAGRPALVLTVASGAAWAWFTLACRQTHSPGEMAAVATILVAGLAMALSRDLLEQSRAESWWSSLALNVALAVAGLALVIGPGVVLSALVIHPVEPGGARIAGIVLLHEVALWAATRRGWLRFSRPIGTEAMLLGVVALLGMTAVALVGESATSTLALSCLVARGLTVPLLRR